MAVRITKEVLFLRHEFTKDERLKMGDDLAQAYNRKASIEEEEGVMKTQIKDRKAVVEQTIGTLSRNLANGYDMVNVDCDLIYDNPNVGEVSYKRRDTGEIIPEKTRVMTESERQMDLPLEPTDAQVQAALEQTEKAVDTFFPDKEAPKDGEEPKDDPDGKDKGKKKKDKPKDDDPAF